MFFFVSFNFQTLDSIDHFHLNTAKLIRKKYLIGNTFNHLKSHFFSYRYNVTELIGYRIYKRHYLDVKYGLFFLIANSSNMTYC